MKKRLFIGFLATAAVVGVAWYSLSFSLLPNVSESSNQIVRDLATRGTSGGLVIFAEGESNVESYWGYGDLGRKKATSSGTLYNIGSLSKQFTGLLLMMLEEGGKVSRHDRLERHLPELGQTEIGKATIEELAQMSSGLPAIEPVFTKLKSQIFSRTWTSAEIVREISTYKLLFQPGKGFQYSNLGYSLLGVVISRIEGKPLSVVLEDRIFKPFKMTNSYLDVPERQSSDRAAGYFPLLGRWIPFPNWNYSFLQGAGGIVSNVRDLQQWIRGFHDFLRLYPKFKKALFFPKSSVRYDYGWSLGRNGLLRHSGETPGFCAYIVTNQIGRVAAYTLNTDICSNDSDAINRSLDRVIAMPRL